MARLYVVLLWIVVLLLPAPLAHASVGEPPTARTVPRLRPPHSGVSPETAFAPDGTAHPLAPQSTMWFKFHYRGNSSPIEIRLMDGAEGRAPDITFAVYTPDQMERRQRGEGGKPIGQMTRAYGEPPVELVWVGKFNRGGTYFVSVSNPSALTLTIRLVASGTAVEFPQPLTVAAALSPMPVTDAHDRASAPTPPTALPIPAYLVSNAVTLEIPPYVGVSAPVIGLTARPTRCTPAHAMPASVTRAVLLCPDQIYRPFKVTGSNLTVYGDPTALIEGTPRGFGITVTGDNVTIVGVRVAASTHPADINKWLCLYEACVHNTMYQNETVQGGAAYGGGILLLNNANSAVLDSVVWGGTIGVASVRSRHNKIANNTLSNLNGWGVYLMFAEHNYVVYNTLDDVNRGCVAPDGLFYQGGCESAAFACAGCQNTVVVGNACARAGNCYYADGLGGLPSNDNKFFNNRCAAAGNNCFEITFSHGNQFDYNLATFDPVTGLQCNYPFWIAGSVVYFGRHNDWACTRQQKRAEEDSKRSTNQHTEIKGL